MKKSTKPKRKLATKSAHILRSPARAPLGAIRLSSTALAVDLLADHPVVVGYRHLTTGARFGAGSPDGVLKINGIDVPWNRWTIAVRSSRSTATYALRLADQGIAFTIAFRLKGGELSMVLNDVKDPGERLRTVEWKSLPLLTCDDPRTSFWRLGVSEPDTAAWFKMWLRDAGGTLGEAVAEPAPVPILHGCLWGPHNLAAFVHSDFPVFPVLHQVQEGGRYAIGLNTYHYRVRGRVEAPLHATVGIIGDINGDGAADQYDFCLWVNRRIPDGDPLYRTHVWYKIVCRASEYDQRRFGVGTVSTFAQAGEIVRALANVTDGLPQVVYLVGWQYNGHDTGYPSMDKVNEENGGEAGLRALIEEGRRHRAVISCHCNIDESYPGNPGHDDSLVGMWYPNWEDPKTLLPTGGLCHVRDVETGTIFRKLEAMFQVAPVEKTIHFDNFRITNCCGRDDVDRHTVVEEAECGFRPIMDWLKERGITVTTEGTNGIPVDLSPYLSGFWHSGLPAPAYLLWHRRLYGGGMTAGAPTRWDCALGTSIHEDISYGRLGPGTLCFTTDFAELVSRVYLGTLLYFFEMEHEMLSIESIPGGRRVRYGDGLAAEVVDDHLAVTWNDLTIAVDDDRFIPRGKAVYAYSLGGSEREWVLPGWMRRQKLVLSTLTPQGPGPAPVHEVVGNRIRLRLAPQTPVKIVPTRQGKKGIA